MNDNLNEEEQIVLRNLSKNKDIIMRKADKGYVACLQDRRA